MIYCDECGWAYKRRVQNGITYWVCSRKGNSGHECGGKNLLESEIFSSFTEFDDVTVRRLVECIQVCGNKKIIVTLKGGYQAEEELKREVAA